MRLHFTIGCNDYRRTTRSRQSLHFSIIQILLADHVHRRTGVHNKFSFLFSLLMARVDTNFPKVRRMLFYVPLVSRYILPASTLLHGHITLAIASLPETDPQILGRWGCADEDHLGKLPQAMDFGLEC